MWITYEWHHQEWWTDEVSRTTVNCTDEELEDFLIKGRVLTLNHYAVQEDREKVTDQGIVSLIFQCVYVIHEMYTHLVHSCE